MKIKLPKLTAAGQVAFFACFTLFLSGFAAAQSSNSEEKNFLPSVEAQGEDGKTLMRRAVTVIEGHSSIAAKSRQKVKLFGQVCLGSGEYLQQGPPEHRLLRLALRMQVGPTTSSLLHVSDGRYLWRSTELAPLSTLERVDLAQVQAVQAKQLSAAPSPLAPLPVTPAALSVGGLPGVVETLSLAFDFHTVRRGELQGMPVHVLYGNWNPGYLTRLFPTTENLVAGEVVNLRKLPAHMPHSVIVLLGVEDMFPYLIEYHRHDFAATREEGETPGSTAIATIEWFEVQLNGPVNPQEFVYRVGARKFTDATASFLQAQGFQPQE